MKYAHKLAAGAAWVTAKLRAVLGGGYDGPQQHGGREQESSHPYLLLLPPSGGARHPRG